MSEQNDAPRLPADISSNGAEIWDWAARLSAYTKRKARMAELVTDIGQIGQRCGDCHNWMKSGKCPREKNVNGRNHGPSMNDFVFSCSKFAESAYATDRRAKLQAELAQLERT